MSGKLDYDETNPKSIENYGKKLIGKTFLQVCVEDDIKKAEVVHDDDNYEVKHENKKRKGGLGELIEERFFHYPANNDARADFDKAGVELKVTPYKINKNGTKVAKERLVLTMIDYYTVVNETFFYSHVWEKSRLILLVYYLYQKEIKNRLNYRIDYVQLFTPSEEDLKIIEHDYYVIVNKIKNGQAHELSESDTLYLGAAPKASSSKDRRKQPFSDELAKPRAFAFKSSYMTYILNHYILPERTTYEPIIKEKTNEPFEKFVTQKIDAYCGYSIKDLCDIFHIDIKKKAKNLGAMLVYRILGIKGNKAEEFEKANIVIKTIRIQNNNKIKENMSFPTFKFKELIQEDWNDSEFGNYLRETRFLFVVYKFDHAGELRLRGCQFWNIPYHDLETDIKCVWEKTREVIRNGLQVEIKNGRHYNNFPKSSENSVCHVRPHARNAQDTYELPDGKKYPKQCFWLNNTYIKKQLDKKFLIK
ncbi:MAG: restriction endonuclease [Clostridiales bacterium]|nr:restriction endonuclease [Clostridiales bacterium]